MMKKTLILPLQILLSLLVGHFIFYYFKLPTQGAISFLLGLGVFVLVRNSIPVRSLVVWIFSVLFSLSLVLSSHVTMSGGYVGKWDKNYISDYSLFDVAAFFLITYLAVQIVWRLLHWLGTVSNCGFFIRETQEKNNGWNRLMEKPLWVYVLIMVICWLPWMLAWYPGFVFGDSINSVRQALGLTGLNNHHPIAYTMWVKLWIELGQCIHDVTFGAALYTLSQMIIVAWGLAWTSRWLYKKSVNPAYCIFTLAYFSLTPFFAQMNISMWKDPLFSIAGLILMIRLYDLFDEESDWKKSDVLLLCLFAVIVCLLRNNGVYIILFTSIAVLLLSFFAIKKVLKKRALCLSGAFCVLSIIILVVQGPIFTKLHWNQSFAEVVGIPLNQMARVVVYNGEMSDRNKNFMNELYPIDKVRNVYTPGHVDQYKWAQGFNTNYLNTHKKEFFSNYVSMMVKNPRLAFEGWEMQTIGYWSVIHYNFERNNIAKGCLWCLKWWPRDHQLKVKNLLENKYFDARSVFSPYDATVSLGVIVWLLLLVFLISLFRKDTSTQISLLPLIALVLSLLVASPVSYWERYGYMLCLSLPLILCYLVAQSKDFLNESSESLTSIHGSRRE